MTNTTPPVQVPDSIRVPLDSLHADAEYLLARLLAGTLTREQVVGVIRDRIDAAQLEIESLKARLEPAGEYPPLPEPLVLEQGYDPGDMPDAYTADQMRAYVDADRAMRAQAAPAAVAGPELAETANDLTRCPNCGGPADNGHDREVPPSPYWCSKCTES